MRQRCGRFGFNISITTNQEAIRALFRVMNRYVGNLPPMAGVFPHQKQLEARHGREYASCIGEEKWPDNPAE
jgi:hypothetical protein